MYNKNEFNILVIDDDPSIHKDFLKILHTPEAEPDDFIAMKEELFGKKFSIPSIIPSFKVDTFLSGKEAIAIVKAAQERNEHYAVAFVDMRLPDGWSGIETVRQLWNIDLDIQIVMCTAYSDYTWEETIRALGTGDNLLILKKPFDIISARQLAFAMAKKWKLLQESHQYTRFLEEKIADKTQALQAALSVMRATLESSADGILVVDNAGIIIDYNKKVLEFFPNINNCTTKTECILQNKILPMVEDKVTFLNKLEEIAQYKNMEDLSTIKLLSGKIIEYYTQAHTINNEIAGRVWSFRDVTAKTALKENLTYQATHDVLTNLPNRILLLDRIEQAIKISDRNKSMCSIFFIDLDGFKEVNDSLGHEAGDEVLIKVATLLQQIGRETNTVARLGGDEFVVLISDVYKEADLLAIANKIILAISIPFEVNTTEVYLTASIGISIYPKDGLIAKDLLHNADLAMYVAKKNGSNTAKFYSYELSETIKNRFSLAQELHNAIKNEEFYLEYQPQYDIPTKKLTGLEALIRWKHPIKGNLLPGNFIPIAENSGLIVAIGAWVLEKVCLQIKKWQAQGIPLVRVAINVSEEQLKKVDFYDSVMHLLKKLQISPTLIEFEITENIVIRNDIIVKTLKKLSEAGFLLSFDDFGTGNSTLSYLRSTPIDRLKIDKSFIQSLDTNASDEGIVSAIIAMAKSMNLHVVAEGVETEKQLEFLKSQNCETVQGFYFSTPLNPEEIGKILTGQ